VKPRQHRTVQIVRIITLLARTSTTNLISNDRSSYFIVT
jgi:hypothetical protein